MPKLLAHGEEDFESRHPDRAKARVRFTAFEMPAFGKLEMVLQGKLSPEAGRVLAHQFALSVASIHEQGLVLTHLNINSIFVGSQA